MLYTYKYTEIDSRITIYLHSCLRTITAYQLNFLFSEKKKADSGNIFVLLFESIGHLYVVACKFQKRSTRSARIYVYARRETADSLERRAHLR